MNQGKAASLNTADLPIIDWELCIKLANNKSEVAKEILGLVIQQLPLDLETIQQALRNKDYPELLRQVHKLHGALCYSGLPRLKSVVLRLEGFLKQKNIEEALLLELMEELKQESENILARRGAPTIGP